MENTSQLILNLQTSYNDLIDRQASLLKEQFDKRVDITILRLLFREANAEILEELELAIYEQEVAFNEIRNLDMQLVSLEYEIERVGWTLDSL